jgi:hypothetical protein
MQAARARGGDLVLWVMLGLCRVVAWPVALAQERRLRHGGTSLLHWLAGRPCGVHRAVRRIAFTRLARGALKLLLLTGGEAAVLRRVRCRGLERLPQGGCVLVLAHSPWGRVLARWAQARSFAFIFAHRRWAPWAGSLHLCPTPAGLRQAVAHLAQGRRVVVVADEFVARGGCEVELCGRRARVSMRAARLAASAGVPLVPVRLSYRRDDLRVVVGSPLDPGRGWAAHARITRALVRQLSRWTARRPEEWNDLFEFFGRAS